MNTAEKARHSITAEFSECILSRFKKAVNEYRLISDGDKILMCVSGGKDSALCSLLLEEFLSHGDKKFSLSFLSLDPGYGSENAEKLKENAKKLEIPLNIKNANIFKAAEKSGKNPCFVCSRIRRAELFKYAEENGFNKIALGHHFDDVIETVLMGLIYGGQMQTMLPKRKSKHFEGIMMIRPMYFIREEDILSWQSFNGLEFLSCSCGNLKNASVYSKRAETKELIKELKKKNPQTEMNIFRSAQNVDLDNLLSYKDSSGVHSFLDNF